MRPCRGITCASSAEQPTDKAIEPRAKPRMVKCRSDGVASIGKANTCSGTGWLQITVHDEPGAPAMSARVDTVLKCVSG